jgi:UDP-glucose 4-epimerase
VNFAGIPRNAPRDVLRAVNVDGPARLARAARAAGASQFVTISSAKIYGRAREIAISTPEDPRSAYGKSKRDCDAALLTLQSSAFAVASLRIPIAYGPGIGESLHALARLSLRLGWIPSPSRLVRRSVVHAENLALAIATVLDRRCSGIVLAADAEPLTFDVFAEILSQSAKRNIRLVRGLNPLLRPALSIVPSLYDRIYADCVFRKEDCLTPNEPYPISLRNGLRDFLSVYSVGTA